ncbi:hypothetical protein PG999_002319 [Apiospora kogelbergensis]|uniref:Rhodopsin domain-containing protein n=2 Tax=Apiospora kogelbergensis TaxID=1337665 RepID=A0AAW0R7V5_9PEZI
MKTQKKLGVTSIFMVGLFTIGASIARMYMYLITSYQELTNPDLIADVTLALLWSDIEANIALMVCCIPTLAPVIGRCRERLIPGLFTPAPKGLFSSNKSKASGNTYTELSDVSKSKPTPSREAWNNRENWAEVPGTVAAAGYSGTVRLNTGRGIMAHTEVSTSYGPAHDVEAARV